MDPKTRRRIEKMRRRIRAKYLQSSRAEFDRAKAKQQRLVADVGITTNPDLLALKQGKLKRLNAQVATLREIIEFGERA